jgi:copper transport protein
VATDAGGSPLVGGLHALFRGVAFFGAVLALGGTFFLLLLWPAGLAQQRPRRLVTTGWVASALAAVALFLLQGPYGAWVGLSGLVDPSLVGDTLATRFGKLMLLRLVVLGCAGAGSAPAGRAGR